MYHAMIYLNPKPQTLNPTIRYYSDFEASKRHLPAGAPAAATSSPKAQQVNEARGEGFSTTVQPLL